MTTFMNLMQIVFGNSDGMTIEEIMEACMMLDCISYAAVAAMVVTLFMLWALYFCAQTNEVRITIETSGPVELTVEEK